ncbi:MAG TPA: hypothetical protein VIK74_09520, partial [Parasegetibacter sp.]
MAASIWGAKAGNGVIVLTTKRAHYNQPFKLSFNSNLQIIEAPDLLKYPSMSSASYIEIEKLLFENGIFDGALSDSKYPSFSPVVEILSKRRSNLISAGEADAQIALMESLDVRKDFEKYIYRTGINNQYALNMSGGTANAKYLVSAGYDKSLS